MPVRINFFLQKNIQTIIAAAQEIDASNHVNNPETYTVSNSFTLEEPTLEGYIFDGWTYGEVMIPTKDVAIVIEL